MYLSSPVDCIELRDQDPTGNGWFGAKRGVRLHKGVDIVTKVGEKIYACCSGRVRIGYVYNYSRQMKLIEIKGTIGVHKVKVQQMYVEPIVKRGQYVKAGQLIGYAQDIATFHKPKDAKKSKMKNHLHVSVWKNGLLTDPEPIIINN